MSNFQLRTYQLEAVNKLIPIMRERNLGYLAAEVRTGKNFMSFTVAKALGWRKVCFITKKSAFEGVKSDYQAWDYKFLVFDIFNFEQAPNIHPVYDGYIIDEAHCIGAFAKPGKYCQAIRKAVFTKKSPVLLMSGTPHPESPSQLFHQFWVSPFSPFQGYGHRSGEFYGWAKEYVDVKQKFINGFRLNDYSKVNEPKLKEVTQHYMVEVSQQDAGFQSYVQEEIFTVNLDPKIYQLMSVLKTNKIYQMKKTGDYIVADTPARMMQVFHQLSSGTIITGTEENGNRKAHVLDTAKVEFIKKKFFGKKIAIYYKYVAEGELLKKEFPNWTDSDTLFNQRDDLYFIRQMQGGSMGVNLSTVDWLVMFSIDFSAKTYWQVRARMQTQTRTKASRLAWIFSDKGIEPQVLKSLQKKKNFTERFFKKFF
jgi:hypothetical protein